MPYPILTLSYPFSRRLCQLLTPDELENLQIAAGPEIRNLKPINPSYYYRLPHFSFFKNTNKVGLFLDEIDKVIYNFTPSLLKCETLIITNVTEYLFKKSNFSHIYFKANKIAFARCYITVELLEYFASIINANGLRGLIFATVNDHDDDVDFAFMFNTFPNLNELSLSTAHKGWVSDLLNADVTNLRAFYIYHNDYDELFSFKASDLYKFIKKQLPNLNLQISIQCDPNATESDLKDVKKKIKKLMTRRFRFRTGSHIGKLMVTVYYYADFHNQSIVCFYG